jgi:ribonuclease Z
LVSSFQNTEISRSIWREGGASASDPAFDLRVIYHLSGDGVLEDEGYKAFMNGFPSDVQVCHLSLHRYTLLSTAVSQHVVASREHCPDPVTFTSAAYTQLRLNNLDEKMFPIPKYSLTPKKNLSCRPCSRPLQTHLTILLVIPNLPLNVQPMSSGLHVCMRPYSPPLIDPEAISLDKFHPAVAGVESLILSTALKRRMSTAKANIQGYMVKTLCHPSKEDK